MAVFWVIFALGCFAMWTIVMIGSVGLIGGLGISIGVVAIVALAVGPFIIDNTRQAAALQKGVPAKAEVLKITQTGTYVNQNPQVKLTLKVMPMNHPAFEVTVEKLVNLVDLSSYQPGAQLNVKYLPDHPSWLAVEDAKPQSPERAVK